VSSNRADVRDFLVTRRGRITPQQAGLSFYGGNRRVPGLRREEVAMLAGVSADYYTRLEKGNLAGVSDSVLEAIAGALQLSEAERLHLFDLARTANTSPARAARRRPPPEVRPGIRLILDGMTDTPAFVRNGRLDILAINSLGRALYSPVFAIPGRPANLARFQFFAPAAREFYPSFEDSARTTVELLRTEAGRDPFNPSLTGLIGELSTRSEEFRALRTRLNHMQSRQPIRTVVITSASPAEGKSFTATNLALAQAQLSGNRVLLCDFDLRRPAIHKFFQMDRGPGITDYLLGKVALPHALRRIGDSNLYVMPAGEAVINPLELLNLPEAKQLFARVSATFHWTLIDTPPLLFAADGNLLATLCDATILVVRIGETTIDSVARARQALCQDNVIGIVVNGARRGELYNKYTYYNSYADATRAG